jgi:hypothetical protein
MRRILFASRMQIEVARVAKRIGELHGIEHRPL